MAVKLICGPAGSGKTSRAVAAFNEALDGGKRPVFLVPGRPDVLHFQRRVLRERAVLSDAALGTFEWFVLNSGAEEILKRRATRVERQLMLRAAVKKAGRLEYLSRSAAYAGFIDSLGGLVAELQAAGVTPQAFADACRELLPRGLNNDIFNLLLEYNVALERQALMDTETDYRRAIAALEKDPTPLDGRVFIIHGFHDFTPLQMKLLEIAAGEAGQLIVTLPFVEGSPGHRSSAPYFSAMSDWPGFDCEDLAPAGGGGRPPDQDHVRRERFAESPRRAERDGSLKILEGAGSRGQAELIAANILHLKREEGIGLDDMAVVCRSLGADARTLLSVFEEYGIPWDYGGLEPLRDSQVGQGATALLEFVMIRDGSDPVVGDGPAGCLLRYLRCAMPGYFKVDDFARLVRLRGIGEVGQLLDAWKEVGGRPLGELERLSAAAASGVSELAGEMERALTGVVRRELAVEGAGGDVADVSAGAGHEADILSLVTVASIMREAASLSEDGKVRGSAAAELLREAIEPVMIDIPFGNRRGCVRVVDPHRIMNQEFDVVFICGLLEKQFPAAQRFDPFIDEEVRGRLAAEQGIELEIVDRDRWIDEERFLFLQTATRARRRLFLCYPYCDSQGSANVHSIFVEEVGALFENPDGMVRTRRISEVTFAPDEAPTPAAALHSLCLAAGNMHSGRKAIPKKIIKLVERAAVPAGIDARLEKCLAAVGPVEFQAGAFIKDHFSAKDRFSATGLESYCSCPFDYFVERVLRPAPMDLDTFFLDRGRIAHAALADFHSRMSRAEVVLWRADREQLAMAREQMDQALEEAAARYGLGDSVEARVMTATLRFYLQKLIDRQASFDGGLIPGYFEYGFGGLKPGEAGSSGLSDITPQLGGWAKLEGRIDRIDLAPGTCKAAIIDYKSSFKGGGWGTWLDKCLLQLPLYIFAARQLGFDPVYAAYYALNTSKEHAVCNKDFEELLGDRPNRWNRASGKAFDELVTEAERLAVEAAEGIRSGDFSKTADRDRCSGCDTKGVCRG